MGKDRQKVVTIADYNESRLRRGAAREWLEAGKSYSAMLYI